MITTLRTGALTLSSVQYKFDANKLLTIKLTTTGDHKLYGDVNIALANVLDINIYNKDGVLIEDFFNNTFSFSRIGASTLEYSTQINSGVAQSEVFTTLSDSGSAITATVANNSFSLERGTYNFTLIDSVDSVFSTSRVGIREVNIGGNGINGIQAEYDELGVGAYLSIHDEDLTFIYGAEVSIVSNSGTTNIPLIITKLS